MNGPSKDPRPEIPDPQSAIRNPHSETTNPQSPIPNPQSLRALILEDRPADAELMVAELRRQGIALEWTRVETEADFVAALDDSLDVILSDFNLPGLDALRAIAHVRRLALSVPVIVVTGAVGEETAAQCIREGATDYLLKDRLARLGLAVSQAVARRRLADQRQQIEGALIASQSELATVFDSAPVAMVIVDHERRVVRANRAASRLAGRPADEVFGRRPGDAFKCLNALTESGGCGTGQQCSECPLRVAVSATLEDLVEHHGVECTLPFGGRGGTDRQTILVSSAPIATTMGTLAVVSLEDITERHRALQRERRLASLLGTIRDVNQLIVREQNRDWILAESCRIVVERVGFRLAWIGEAEQDTGIIRPLTVAGDPGGAELLGKVKIHWDTTNGEMTSIATAIREHHTVIVTGAETDTNIASWRKSLQNLGLQSSITLPLVVNGRDFGALMVYGAEPDEFDDEIVGLLEELADDLGFALGALETAARRAAAEGALHASEERFRGLFEQAPIGIYRTTPEGRILAANPGLVAMLGFESFEELAALDLELDGLALPDERRAFREAIEAKGELIGHLAEWRTRDGRPLFVRENARAVRSSANGRVLCYEGTVEDVTEAHKARRERDQLYELAVDMFCVTDFAGYLKQLNPAWERNLGWSLDELRAKPFLSFIHASDRAAALASYAALGKGDTVLGSENRVACRDGSYRWMSWNAFPLVEDGLIFAVAHDITERRGLEEQLRQSQKMEAVGRLAGGVAHDFNNLLQALLSQTQLVRGHSDDPARLAVVADEIEQHVRRGAALTRQLLLFSRRETTQVVWLDLNQVVREQSSLLRRLVRANITLDLQLASVPLPVAADHGQLEQVLMNLVVNASDVLPDGGAITIRSGCDSADEVWLAVEDDGPGVPDQLRAKVFEPFFTTKPSLQGTGLGLSVVHGIVIQHGGRIAIDDRSGGGSVFTVTLPRAAGDAPTTAAAPIETAPAVPFGHHERVLVVEDEPATREGLSDLLTALNYEVIAVGSAEEASSLPDSPSFDVLLTDLMLPGIPGTELAGMVRQRWPQLQVLLMSGYNEDEIVRRGIDSGTVRFLQKPFDMRTLATELRHALDGSGAHEPACSQT